MSAVAARTVRARAAGAALLLMGAVITMSVTLVPMSATMNPANAAAPTVTVGTSNVQLQSTAWWTNTNVSSTSAGGDTTCAIEDGRVYCWGGGGNGVLGVDPIPGNYQASRPLTVASTGGFSNSGTVSAVVVGHRQACALEGGIVYCWGWRDVGGNIGDGRTSGSQLTPLRVPSAGGFSNNGTVSALSSSNTSTCAVEGTVAGGDARLYCWGVSPVLYAPTGGFSNNGTVSAVSVANGRVCVIEGVSPSAILYCAVGSAPLARVPSGGGFSNNGTVSAVSVGSVHVCAIEGTAAAGDARLYCWNNDNTANRNVHGMVGDGTTTNRFNTPVRVASTNGFANNGTVSAVTLGGLFSCAIEGVAPNAALYCWGWNGYGQLGDGTSRLTGASSDFRSSPVKVVPGAGFTNTGNVVAVEAGNQHICATEEQASDVVLYCWGLNSRHALGDGQDPANEGSHRKAPVLVVAQLPTTVIEWQNSNVTQVDVGSEHTCAIQRGVLFCWGAGTRGQLGFLPPPRPPVLPSPTDQPEAVRVAPYGEFSNTRVTAVAASGSTTCAIEYGKVFCWGANGVGQVGIGTFTSRVDTPRKVSPANGFQNDGNVTAVGTSGLTTCAIESGVVYCWGANGLGAVGNGSTTGTGSHPNRPQKVVTNGDFANSGVTAITVGTAACAVEAGELFCWGAGSSGQMGDGTLRKSNPRPVKVGPGSDGFVNNSVTSVSSVGITACAVRLGAMYCWGGNGYGNGGVGVQVSQQTSPRKVSAVNGMTNAAVTSASVGNASCVVDAGIVYCMGINYYGMVGDGTTTQRLSPTLVSATGGMANNGSVTMVSAEESHACAIEFASVYCWGKNDKGQMGNGTTGANRLSPQNASAGPGTPVIDAVTVGTTTATVTVSAGPGVTPTSYAVTAQPGGATCTVTSPETSCGIAGLTSGTVYTFNAVASIPQAVSQLSDGVTATTGAVSVPGAPGVVAGDEQLQVTPVPGGGGGTPSGFVAYASPNGGTCTVVSPAASCTIGPLANGTAYTVTTAAFNEAGFSGPGVGVTPTVGAATAPDAPSITVGNQTATVSVSPSTSGGTAAFFTVRASAAGQPTHLCTVDPPATSCVLEGLTNGITYDFTTTATNGGGTSAPSVPVAQLVDVVPVPLEPSVMMSATGVTVSVSSDASGGTTQYQTVYLEPDGHTCTVTPPATSCFIALSVRQPYTVTTTATNGVGTSSASPAHVFAFDVPGTPQLGVLPAVSGSATVMVSPGSPGGPPSSYEVFVGPGRCSVVVPATSCTVSGLTGGQTYTATASATNALGTTTNSVGIPVPLTPPDAPTPGAPVVGHGSATVSVSPAGSGGIASLYTVTASAVGEPFHEGTCTVEAPGTACMVTGLTNGRTYEFSAGASNAYGASATSATTTSALVDVAPLPLAPTVLVGATTLTVSVSASPDGGSTNSFTVYAMPGGYTCTVETPTASACTIPSSGALPVARQLYTVTVTATNAITTSASSPGTTALFDPPSTPSVGDLVLGVNSVTVSVIPGPETDSGPASYFTVFAGPGSCGVTPPATSCMVPNLTPGNEYSVTVSASNGKGSSLPSEPATARLILPPTPAAPVVAVLEPGSVFVMVIPPAPPEAPTSFVVATTTSAGAGPGCVITPPEVACTLNGLGTNTQYAISTVVTNAYGSSPTGSATTVLMAQPPVPLAPLVVPGSQRATVTIRPGAGGGVASSYLVFAEPGGFSCEVDPLVTLSCVVEELTNDVEYTFTVRASNGIGGSDQSPAMKGTPRLPLTPPPPPSSTSTTTTTVPRSTTTTTRPPTSTTRPPSTTTTTVPPVMDPVTGALPALPLGEATVLADGEPVVAGVELIGGTEVLVRSSGVELVLQAECVSGCEVTVTPDGRPVIQLEEAGGVRVSGVGFRPGTFAYVWLFSAPRLLGTVAVKADGTFSGSLPLTDVEAGVHTLQVNGISATGGQRSANLGVLVNEVGIPTPGPGRLPATGQSGGGTLVTWALLCILTGGVVRVRRRPV